MADSQATSTIELQTPPNWAESLAEASSDQLAQRASAADEARRHVEEGFTTDDLRKELKRSKRSRAWKRFGIVLGVIIALIAAAAIAVVVFCSVNQVNSDSMAPTLQNGQIVVSSKDTNLSRGDVLAYRDGDEVMFGRVVAEPGSWVNIMGDGALRVTDKSIGSPSSSASAQSSGSAQSSSSAQPSGSAQSSTNVQPSMQVKITRQVPPDSYYVLSDAEDATISGLANAEDFITADQIIGKSLFTIWPITNVGPVQ